MLFCFISFVFLLFLPPFLLSVHLYVFVFSFFSRTKMGINSQKARKVTHFHYTSVLLVFIFLSFLFFSSLRACISWHFRLSFVCFCLSLLSIHDVSVVAKFSSLKKFSEPLPVVNTVANFVCNTRTQKFNLLTII